MLSDHDKFMDLSFELFYQLLAEDYFIDATEDLIFKTIRKWVQVWKCFIFMADKRYRPFILYATWTSYRHIVELLKARCYFAVIYLDNVFSCVIVILIVNVINMNWQLLYLEQFLMKQRFKFQNDFSKLVGLLYL